MKKFLSGVLALMMVFSMFATVSAAGSVASYISSTDEYFLSYTLPITIEARRSNPSGAYVASPLNIVDSNLPNGIGVDFMAKLDMEQLQTLFSSSLMTGFLAELEGDLAAKTEFNNAPVTTTVTVKIEYPGATVANADTAGSLTSGDTKFVQNGSRVISGNTAEITYNNTTLTVGELMSNQSSWLDDVVFKLEGAEAAVYNTEGNHEVKVTFSGETALEFSSLSNPIKIKYTESTATYTVVADIPSSGGGGSSYNSIKFVTNGGNELKNISVRRGGKVSELPVPVREGYVFTGWYTDSALKTPFDKDTVINKNYTLYAAWVEDSGTVEIVHETPEMLNGEDHFAYVLGYPDGTVRPNENITRAEVTSIFFRLLKDEVREENLTNDNSFNDVNGEDWYNTAVSTMAKLGIVNGRTADEFVPNANITRAEFAAICARFDESQYSIVDKFTDIISHWAEDEIHETAAYGWIKGYEDGTFKPDKAITRAEAMTMINRVLNRVPETADDLLSDMIVWPDNSESDWYYLPVQEATNGHNYEMKNNIYEKWTEITDVTDWTKYE